MKSNKEIELREEILTPKDWLLQQPEEIIVCLEVLERMNKEFIAKAEVEKMIYYLEKNGFSKNYILTRVKQKLKERK